MKEIKKAEIQAVTDGGLPFSLRLTHFGSWEAKIVFVHDGARLIYYYSDRTLDGVEEFISRVEQTTKNNVTPAPL